MTLTAAIICAWLLVAGGAALTVWACLRMAAGGGE